MLAESAMLLDSARMSVDTGIVLLGSADPIVEHENMDTDETRSWGIDTSVVDTLFKMKTFRNSFKMEKTRSSFKMETCSFS